MLHLSENIGVALTEARKASCLSLEQLAAAAGVDLTTLWRIENGQTKSPSITTIRKIERALSSAKAA